MELADQHAPQGLTVIARSSQKAGLRRARCAALGASPQAEAGLSTPLDRAAPAVPGPRNFWGCRAEPVIHDLADAGRRMQLFRVL